MSELEEKKALADKLNQEVRELEEKERIEKEYPEKKKLEGTYWKYRNCYSCPTGDADYWWLYRKITSVTPDGNMMALEFQIDKDGRLEVKEKERISWRYPLLQGWQPSTIEEWHEAAQMAKVIVEGLLK